MSIRLHEGPTLDAATHFGVIGAPAARSRVSDFLRSRPSSGWRSWVSLAAGWFVSRRLSRRRSSIRCVERESEPARPFSFFGASRTNRSRGRRPGGGQGRSGLTLVELLVTMTVTLLMVVAMVEMFRTVSKSVAAGKANLDLASDLRGVFIRSRSELDGLTADVRPSPEPGAGMGYLEILDGNLRDAWTVGVQPQSSMFGDMDDVVSYTVRSTGEPFVGRWLGGAITSRLAEVVWWTRWDDFNQNGVPESGEVTLFHRVFLIRPDLNTATITINTGSPPVLSSWTNSGYLSNLNQLLSPPQTPTPLHLMQFFQDNDVSVRLHRDTNGSVIGFAANSMADLTRRENRFAHHEINMGALGSNSTGGASGDGYLPIGVAFPYPIRRGQLVPRQAFSLAPPLFVGIDGAPGRLNFDDDANGTNDDLSEIGWFGSDDLRSTDLAGEDVALTSVMAYDVRVWDPRALLRYNSANPNETLGPGDPGYNSGVPYFPPPPAAEANARFPRAHGAFVDLFYSSGLSNPVQASDFSGAPQGRSRLNLTMGPTFCTWSFDYEHDGIDQDGAGGADQGTDGFDSDNSRGVDDQGEWETMPPYPVPLRGMQIRIRCFDNDTRQVRQTSIVTNFIPE